MITDLLTTEKTERTENIFFNNEFNKWNEKDCKTIIYEAASGIQIQKMLQFGLLFVLIRKLKFNLLNFNLLVK